MPELPEVETWRRLAEKHMVNGTLQETVVSQDDIVFDRQSPNELTTAMKGKRVLKAERKGKHLWLELEQGPFVYIHFGMTGSLKVYQEINLRPRFFKVEWLMDHGNRVAYTCVRRLGRVRLLDGSEIQALVDNMGRDVYQEAITPEYLAACCAPSRRAIKTLLLDQSRFAGVGNWIADEVLYQSKIDPRKRGCELSEPEHLTLCQKMKSVVDFAVEVNADAHYFPEDWLFHYRWGKQEGVFTSKGRVEFITLGGRTTAFVPDWQCG